MTDPLVLSVDLDGVLVNFRRGFAQTAKALFDVTVPVEASTWHWYRSFLSADQEHEIMATIATEASFWAWLQEEPGAQAAKSLGRLSKASQAGHLVYFMTQRPKIAWQATVQWLQAFGWTAGSPMVLMIGDEGKGSVCNALDVTHAIDDRVEHVQDMARVDVTVACLTRPYNASFEWPYRVESLPAWLEDLGL